ncbi:VWA domain-containing protein [Paenibacillus donghaensis]|uniref:MucBP domain-containing protein n=1 Tax=Paenibacillus donghaensis TaxID=414771 RepID=UPI00188432FA|nr:MucBP domain-containing protein [Paenibacillus donghaensis]MBE9916842.1 VWA domain-containing protein [Paenibacillus donghaensis]
MKRGLKLVVSWLFILTVFTGFIPGNLFLSRVSAASNELIWPNPGAVNLTKTADPAGKGQWNITLTVEGKNIKTTSDVVLVIDRSGSMDKSGRMTNAKSAANKFIDNLLIKDSTTRIAVVTFDKTASEKSSFLEFGQKDSLKNVIKGITVSGEGTNIQAGLNKARLMLEGSQAQNKVIVLLSDGAPTYSYKASHAAAFGWPDKKFDFTLYDFDYNDNQILGNGKDYKLDEGFFGWGGEVYTVDGKTVKNNGIAALSEAKLAWDGGIGIYSIGLEVGKDADAKYVLNNAQNKGYYSSSSADLSKVFSELSGQISYAAQKAVVTDPMGEMFNKVGEPKVSQGTIAWDDKTETFTWNVGSIMEGSPATLTYTVEMDPKKQPDPNTLYPTNGTTTINYTDINKDNVTKNFEVPKVSFGKGSITIKGYRVNADGQPVNAEGVVVEKAELAQQLYNQPFKQDGKESLDINKTYSVAAPNVEGYQLEVGDNPTKVNLTIDKPTPTVWFGFMEAAEQHVSVKYLEKGTNKVLAEPSEAKGIKGQQILLEAKKINGFTAEKESDKYTFTGKEGQEYAFYYTADKQTVTVKYLEKSTGKPLKDPVTVDGFTGKSITIDTPAISGYAPEESSINYTFTAKDGQELIIYYQAVGQQVRVQHLLEGTEEELAEPTIQKGHAGDKVNVALPLPGYTPVKDTGTYTFTADEKQTHIVYYTADKQTVSIRYVDQATNEEIQDRATKEGVTGQVITLIAPPIEGYTPVEAEGKYTFTAEQEGQQYTFYYTAEKPGEEIRTITVRYLEEGTNQELQEPTTRQGEVGKKILLEAPHFEGYVTDQYVVEYPVTSEEKQEYTFFYKKEAPEAEQRTVHIHHVDQETEQPIADPTPLTGKVGEKLQWQAEPITVADEVYTPVEFNHEYLITEAPEQEYTVYYKKGKDEAIQQLLVKFLDKVTNAELGQKTYSGRAEDAITIKPDPITVGGAVYKPEQAEYSYRFTGEPHQELIIYFIKDEIPVEKDQEVTVKYLEQGTGAVLAASTVEKGKAGSSVTLKAASISGYTPVKSSTVYQFENKAGQEFIFYYTKNSPATPPTDPTPSTPGSSSGNSGSVTPLPPAPPVVKPSPPAPPAAVTPLPPAPPKLETATHYNYINGYPDGMIKPENNISREEVAAIFYRLMDDATRSDYLKSTSSYKDVAASRWSSKNIATMENAKVITGYPDGTFKPGRPITRAEFAAIASRFDDLDEQKNTLFSDIKGHWAEKYIVSAANKGWIKGYPEGQFKPDQYITRAEAMAFINSVLNRKVKVEGIHKDAKTWPDNTPNKWYYTDVLEATNYHEYSRNNDQTEAWQQVKPDRVYP